MNFSQVRLVFFSVFVAMNFSVWSQKTELDEKSEESLAEHLRRAEFFESKTTLLLKFEKKPDRRQRSDLQNEGIDLQEFFRSDSSYLAVVREDILPNAEVRFKLISIKKYTAERKISGNLAEALRQHSFPDYAFRSDASVKITLRCLRGFNMGLIRQYLLERGVEISYTGEKSRRITCWLKQMEVLQLMDAAFILSAEIAGPEPVPEYNEDRSNHRANFLSQDFNGGNTYRGEGIKVMLQDDGLIGPHVDYTGRLSEQFMFFNNGDHGDHCAGILMGAGNKDPLAKGMAWGSDLFVYGAGGYQGFDSIYDHYFSKGITISSTSYADGCNSGYTSLAATLDEQIYNMPMLMHVFSAGNNGTQDCNYGAGAGWGNITGGHKHSKNSISAGNLNYLDNLASSSSRGPVHDGRLKPEVCAVGTTVYSTIDSHSYDTKSGTSMACPGVAGALAMLSEAYSDLFGSLPPSSLIKGVVMNTSDDLGQQGPDFKFGYGRINGRKMMQPIMQQQFLTDSIESGQTQTHQILIPSGIQQAKIMICWNDYPAAESATTALINDLDLLVESPSGVSQLPLVLNPSPDPALLDLPAVNGIDHLNNHEQVVLDFPAPGNYQIRISGFDVPFGPQGYSLSWYFEENDALMLTYPNGGEAHGPGENVTLRWDASVDTQSFALAFTVDSGQTWTDINTSVSPSLRGLNFQIPTGIVAELMKIKISRGIHTDESDADFHVMGIPQNFNIQWTCPDSLLLRWDPVAGATAYDIFMLGSKYMDSIATTSSDSFILRNLNAGNQRYWLSVRARNATGTVGRRAIAIQSDLSIFCPYMIDAALSEIESPSGPFYACMGISNSVVRVKLQNRGLRDIGQVPVFYSIDAGIPQSEVLIDTLSYFETGVLNFASLMNLSTPGNYMLKVWCAFPGDMNHDNDTLVLQVRQIQQTTVIPPWTEAFETFGLCSTDPDCGLSTCLLDNGLLNAWNGIEDDIDWRVNAGSTPTSSTGPSQDYLPGTATGKYIYVEASGVCSQKEAMLVSPCIDLSNFVNPRLTFAYHMSGSEMGSLSLDIFSNGNWINSVFFRTGDQGSEWKLQNIPLNNYLGQTIVFRFRGLTAGGGFGDMALDGIMIGNISGMEESSLDKIRIIPNPNQGEFLILAPKKMSRQASVQIFSSEGKILLNRQIREYELSEGLYLKKEDLAPGMYFISIRDGINQYQEKLMIEP